MEPIDGVELVAMLRGRDINIPVVVMTGYADIGLAVRAMKVGAGDFIEKTDEPQILIAAVREALANAQPASEGAAEREGIRRRMQALSQREREVLELIKAQASGDLLRHLCTAAGYAMPERLVEQKPEEKLRLLIDAVRKEHGAAGERTIARAFGGGK